MRFNEVKKTAVVGAGLMGHGTTEVYVHAGGLLAIEKWSHAFS